MTTFIFVRHGKSQANAENLIADDASPLTKQGESQVRKMARELKRQHTIGVIISSPLPRAQRTAEIIAQQLRFKKDIEIIDDLRERGFGELQGHAKNHESDWYYETDGESDIEPRGIVIARAESALNQIKKRAESKEGEVLVVGHAVSGYYLLQVAAGNRYFEQFDAPKQPGNAAAVTVQINPVRSKPVEVRPKLLVSFLAIVLGIALLITGLVLIANRAPAPQQTTAPQSIPLKPEDYNGDPNLQSAVQKQLQQQTGSSQSDTSASSSLQPVQQGIPAE